MDINFLATSVVEKSTTAAKVPLLGERIFDKHFCAGWLGRHWSSGCQTCGLVPMALSEVTFLDLSSYVAVLWLYDSEKGWHNEQQIEQCYINVRCYRKFDCSEILSCFL